ncbi:MAG: hypothetical protein UX65_C0006G0031 [Parcubacteria group bacterium GW2011_GWB1_46_8]|nr:MAG: hypothetical protein UX14_C0007G0009 [Parcubacteria group bacterium GW2011_GWF1_45_5]KKU11011.1 MAG: hypothetical protein UX15_C0017G0003 [Parcubacteria group bacterium GW2011_GWA1_45_7]KKU46266.1 MAG: hypothetical protein UX65_C0006G0031 [Parcubacteria group bacterium GW2011_GWB1_46_8]
MFYVYVLQSEKDGEFYSGFTNNLHKRLLKHNTGKVFSTKSRRPLKCIYTEICLDKQDALQREKYLKTGMGKRFIKQRLQRYLNKITENTPACQSRPKISI